MVRQLPVGQRFSVIGDTFPTTLSLEPSCTMDGVTGFTADDDLIRCEDFSETSRDDFRFSRGGLFSALLVRPRLAPGDRGFAASAIFDTFNLQGLFAKREEALATAMVPASLTLLPQKLAAFSDFSRRESVAEDVARVDDDEEGA